MLRLYQNFGEFAVPAARAVGDAGPYKGKAEQPAKLKFEVPSAAAVEGITRRFVPQFVTNWLRALRGKLKFDFFRSGCIIEANTFWEELLWITSLWARPV